MLGGADLNVVARRAARATARVGLAILGVAVLAGTVRVLPWLVAPHVPFRVALPFARALFAVGLETTLLAAPPIGWAFCAAALVERGEARALFATGASPAGIVRTTLVAALGFALLTALASLAAGTGSGRARSSRASARERVETIVRSERAGRHAPPTSLSSVSPGCVSPMLRRGSRASFRPAVDPFRLAIFRSATTCDRSSFRTCGSCSARKGRSPCARPRPDVRGLAPWGRGSNLSALERALLLSLTGGVTGTPFGGGRPRTVHRPSPPFRCSSGAPGPSRRSSSMSRLEQGDTPPGRTSWCPRRAWSAFSRGPRSVPRALASGSVLTDLTAVSPSFL